LLLGNHCTLNCFTLLLYFMRSSSLALCSEGALGCGSSTCCSGSLSRCSVSDKLPRSALLSRSFFCCCRGDDIGSRLLS
jgi:hypothetical protein